MEQSISILGGRLIDPLNQINGLTDLHLSGSKVVGVGQPPAGFTPTQRIDAKDLWILPGLVDLSARLREPGFEFKSALDSELSAALAGGVTSLVCPPDTDPVLDEPGLVNMLKFRTQQMQRSKVYPLGALTLKLEGEVITEMAELAEAGCVGFSMANVPLVDTNVLLRAMQYARSFGFALWIQPSDPFLSKGGVAHSGAVASRLGLSGISVSAEVIALHTIVELVRSTNCRVHLCRLSSAAGVEVVRRAKAEGLPITADVSIYHTLLTDMDIGFFDTNYRVTPPLRAQRDREAIWKGLADGTLDAICSDHTPVDSDSKMLPFAEAEPGLSGLELLLSLLNNLANASGMGFELLLSRVTSKPAAILAEGLSRTGVSVPLVGTLGIGAAADIVLFAPQSHWQPTTDILLSQGKHHPYLDRELTGRVQQTIVEGVTRFELQAKR